MSKGCVTRNFDYDAAVARSLARDAFPRQRSTASRLANVSINLDTGR
jgi:hypothetical protein